MRAFGSDRVRVGEDGRIFLSCRLPKLGWTPRVERTLTSAAFPGTAILWEDAYYEVLQAEALPNGVRYVLAPWPEEHAIRVSDAYDEPSEARRQEEYRAALARERNRKTTLWLGIFAGHLPAVVQEKLASELGVSAPRLTSISALPGVTLFVVALHFHMNAVMANKISPVPLGLLILAGLLAVDGMQRFKIAWLQDRPAGSALGVILYVLFYTLAGSRRKEFPSPFERPKGTNIYKADLGDHVLEQSAFHSRAPFFTLLPREDQLRLADAFAFDYRRHGPMLAAVVLFFAVCGIATSMATLRRTLSVPALISLLAALYLAGEQVVRLLNFGRGPTGSVLGLMVRPFARRFLR